MLSGAFFVYSFTKKLIGNMKKIITQIILSLFAQITIAQTQVVENQILQSFENGDFKKAKQILDANSKNTSTNLSNISKSILLLEDTNTANYNIVTGEKASNCVNINLNKTFDTINSDFEFSWEFPNQIFYSGYQVSHCFEKSGVYNIKLNFKDNESEEYIEQDTLIKIEIPESDLYIETQNQQIINKKNNFTFINIKQTDKQYLWDMGDGKYKTGNNFYYTFTEQGKYTVKVYELEKNESNKYTVYTKKIDVNIKFKGGPTINSAIDEYKSPK